MATEINLDVAQRVDIICRRGDTFNVELTFNDANGDPLDLSSGYSWKMDVKETDTSSGDIIADDSFTYSGTSGGVLSITADAATMAAIEGGIYVYDLQSNENGIITTWIYGVFKVNEDVSE